MTTTTYYHNNLVGIIDRFTIYNFMPEICLATLHMFNKEARSANRCLMSMVKDKRFREYI